MRIDLHTHSDRSDGTDSPSALVRAAVEAGLDVLGLTDHDTATGWDEAAEAADAAGITVVPGMEISCKHAGRGLHLLAYWPDPTHPALVAELDRILDGRDGRTPLIVEKLRAHGIDITTELVAEHGRDAAAIGRPHVADALVSLGVVGHRDEAFDRWLSPGRPAYVRRYAPTVESMIGIVASAGGVTVVAHPWGRHDNDDLRLDGIARLKAHGLTGIEVDHQDHDARQRAELRAIAAELDLVVTGSSDHHGTGKVDHDLGCNTTAPEEYERLRERAAVASRERTRPA
ncbi:PHP domain-containing protein [Nocardioides caldifontis]|uniref:PHP domain-containing protein n=1 Tax=Nocardioides caldifontis TaxID=2588938 RepID=UPI0011DF1DCB|nr:PHP domain-containing protein [Nocardioides caldifontis]